MNSLLKTDGRTSQNDTQNPGLRLVNPDQQPPAGGAAAVPSSLHDIYGPLEPVEPPPYLLYALVALIPLLIAAALFWWLRKRKNRPAPPIPPGTAARSDLLLAREFMTEENTLQYLEKLSEILRNYIESKFSLNLTRQTTGEFLRSLKGSLPPDHGLIPFKKELQQCLETCDMAKFAHHPATLNHLREMEQTVLDFINVSEPEKTDDIQGGRR